MFHNSCYFFLKAQTHGKEVPQLTDLSQSGNKLTSASALAWEGRVDPHG